MTRIQYVLPPYASQSDDNKKAENSFKQLISASKNIIVLSPHLDDAVLSMGSLLAYLSENNKNTSIISVFTEGSPVISEYNTRLVAKAGYSSTKEFFSARQEEDLKALAMLNQTRISYLGLVDAAWRINSGGEALYKEKPIGVMRESEDTVQLQLLRTQIELYSKDADLIFAPLGCGVHVDHVLVRDAATEVFPKIVYYTDFPYSERYSLDTAFINKQNLLPVVWRGEQYKKKIKAVHAYKTQMQSLFGIGGMRLPWEKFWLSEQLFEKK